MLTSPGSVFARAEGPHARWFTSHCDDDDDDDNDPSRRADPKPFAPVRALSNEEKPPRARLRHRLTGTNGHRTTNITKRGTITEQSNGEKQTIRVGDFKRERRSDRIRGLFRADGVPTGSEDETDDARSHGTKVRIRVKWTERQIDDEKKKTTRRDEILIERRRCSSKHTYRALRS